MLGLEENSVKVRIPGFGIETCKFGKQIEENKQKIKNLSKQELRFQ